MKTFYNCEICFRGSEDKNAILECEAQGRPDLSLAPPIGLLVGDACGPGTSKVNHLGSPRCGGPKWNNGKPCGSHLCGAGFIWVVQHVGEDAHEYVIGFGNFRGNGCGDTFDFKNGKGGYDRFKVGLNRYSPELGFQRWQDWPEAQHCPSFWRAVKALREASIQPTVIREGKAVPVLEEPPLEEDSTS